MDSQLKVGDKSVKLDLADMFSEGIAQTAACNSSLSRIGSQVL